MSDGIAEDMANFVSAGGHFADNTVGAITPQMVRNLAASIVALVDALEASGGLLGGVGRASDGRLTLTSGTPVTTADVASASTLYWCPYHGSLLWIFDGTDWVPYSESQLSVALSGMTNAKKHDVFAYRAGGVTKIDLAVAWTDSTTRVEGVSLLNGVYVNTTEITTLVNGDVVPANRATLLGTILATGTTTTADSAANRNVLNLYNFFTTERQANDLIVNGQTLAAYLSALNNLATTAYNLTSAAAGTAEASKALIADANIDIANIRNLSLTGYLFYPPKAFASLPAASTVNGARVRITDRGQKGAYSDGTNWRFVGDDTIVS